MLILGVLAAEDSSKTRPLLAQTINTLLDTAKAPLPQDWDQTLDLPQVESMIYLLNKSTVLLDQIYVKEKSSYVHKRRLSADLSQVCAVHTLQALVKGSSLGVAVLQYTPVVAVLSLTLLSSPCWAMRNAALQLYSTNQSCSQLF